jgi:hypothetical protein
LKSRSDDGRTFTIAVRARVKVPLLEDEVWSASLRLQADFASELEVSDKDAQDFARLSGVFLVWPYARTYLTEFARMAGVTAPMLPLLTRPGDIDLRMRREPAHHS